MQLIFCDNRKKGFVDCCFDYRDVSLKIVNSFLLLRIFFNPTHFILLDISIDISLALENLFASKNMLVFETINKYPGAIS